MSLFDVREILNKYNIPYEESRRNSELMILCPFHDDTNFGSALMNEETGMFNCFSCREGGSIYKFVSLLEKITVSEAYHLVNNNFNQLIDYDIEKLKERKPTVSGEGVLYTSFANSFVLRILSKLISVGNFKFSQKWIAVCNWVLIKPQSNYEEKKQQILELYSLFNQEIKTL